MQNNNNIPQLENIPSVYTDILYVNLLYILSDMWSIFYNLILWVTICHLAVFFFYSRNNK